MCLFLQLLDKMKRNYRLQCNKVIFIMHFVPCTKLFKALQIIAILIHKVLKYTACAILLTDMS